MIVYNKMIKIPCIVFKITIKLKEDHVLINNNKSDRKPYGDSLQ